MNGWRALDLGEQRVREGPVGRAQGTVGSQNEERPGRGVSSPEPYSETWRSKLRWRG